VKTYPILGKKIDLLTGLISVYELNETNGNTAYDAHGSNDLSNNNATINQSGKIGTSYAFDYTSSAYLVNNSPSGFDSFTNEITVSSWFTYTGYYQSLSDPGLISLYNYTSTNRCFSLNITDHVYLHFGFFDTTPSGHALNSDDVYSSIYNNGWHLVIGSYDGDYIRIYLDNTEIKSLQIGAYSINNNSDHPLRIGTQYNVAADYYWTGNIDQSAVWKRTLTSDEISSLWNSGNGRAYSTW